MWKMLVFLLALVSGQTAFALSYQIRNGVIFGTDGYCYRAPGSGVPDWSQFRIDGDTVISNDGLRCKRSTTDQEILKRDEHRAAEKERQLKLQIERRRREEIERLIQAQERPKTQVDINIQHNTYFGPMIPFYPRSVSPLPVNPPSVSPLPVDPPSVSPLPINPPTMSPLPVFPLSTPDAR